MKQLTVVGLCAVLLVHLGCNDAERAVSDASTDAATPDLDAGAAKPADASLDLHFLVIATLIEMERTLTARCPCLTAQGEYDSASECLRAVSLGRHWVDCANRVELSAYDSAEIRESLRCNVAELSLRSECLLGSSCVPDAIAACMTQSLECALIPYDLISEVVSECEITLSR